MRELCTRIPPYRFRALMAPTIFNNVSILFEVFLNATV